MKRAPARTAAARVATVALSLVFLAWSPVACEAIPVAVPPPLEPRIEARLDFDVLRRIIEEAHLGSVEAVLAALPESYRTHFVLVYKTRSLQESSYDEPRVIAYGEDATFIVAYNGSPSERGHDVLETMEFDRNSARFHLREIAFPGTEDGAAHVTFSERDPERCRKCHGTPERPIWDTYPSWPGAYGSDDHGSVDDAERDGLERFRAMQPTHVRYRFLAKTYDPQELTSSLAVQERHYEGRPIRPSPNAALGVALSRLNLRMLLEDLRRSPGFARYRYALLAATNPQCLDVEDFLTDAERRALRFGLDAFEDESSRANRVQSTLKHLRMTPGAAAHGEAIESLTPFRYLAEVGLEQSTRQWTLAMEKGTYDFTTVFPVIADLERDVLEVVAGSDPELAYHYANRGQTDGYCSVLKRRSRLALAIGSHPPTTRSGGLSSEPTLLQTCVGCHESDVGPALRFSDPTEIAKKLGVTGYRHGSLLQEVSYRLSPDAGAERMPLGLNPTDEELTGLKDYLRNLSGAPKSPRPL